MDVNDWVEYKCKTGQTLYIKVAVGNKWPTGNRSSSALSQFKRFCSIGTQTDETGCINGCTSMSINNDILLHRKPASLGDKSNYADEHQNYNSQTSSSMVSKNTSSHNMSFACELSEVLRVLDEEFESPNEESKTINNSLTHGTEYKSKYPLNENRKSIKHEVPEVENIETANQLIEDTELPSMVKERQDNCTDSNEEEQKNFEERSISIDVNESDLQIPNTIFTNQETSKEEFQCMKCKEIFNCKNAYNEHLLTHRRHTCQQCGKEYSYKFYLKYHLITHKQRDIMQTVNCNFCDKKFTDQEEHDVHIKGHIGEKPYVCTTCDKTFKTRNNFKAHYQRVHADGKKYNCTYCDKIFQRSDHLQRHMRKHTGERPHKCIFCGKAFGRKDNLTCHLRTHMK